MHRDPFDSSCVTRTGSLTVYGSVCVYVCVFACLGAACGRIKKNNMTLEGPGVRTSLCRAVGFN